MSIACVTDADLVARALEGDTSAFGELVHRSWLRTPTRRRPRRMTLIDFGPGIVEDGKPLLVAQSADPTSDRKVTVEVKAAILR